MTTYEDTFRNVNGKNGSLMPLQISLDSAYVTATPYGSTQSQITAIRVQDTVRNVWYSWDKNATYPNGSWDNAGGTGNNAPVGQTPLITPGSQNLSIAFNAVNNGSVAGNLTLTIKDGAGNVLFNNVIYTQPGASAGVQVTVNMPSTPYSITVSVTP